MNLQDLAMVCFALVFCSSSAHADFFWNKKKAEEKRPSVVIPATEQKPPELVGMMAVPEENLTSGVATNDRKALYRLKDEQTVEALVKLASGRQLREQELVVVARLINEKQLELTGFNQKLNENFGISEDGNYHYDNETRTLYELKAKPGAEKAPKDAKPEDLMDKEVLRKFEDKDKEETFLKMVGAKKITTDEIRSLQWILQEKKIELTSIQDSLNQQFSMDPEKHYEYDADTQVVYELVGTKDTGESAVTEPQPDVAKKVMTRGKPTETLLGGAD